jgi:hypothetical protein
VLTQTLPLALAAAMSELEGLPVTSLAGVAVVDPDVAFAGAVDDALGLAVACAEAAFTEHINANATLRTTIANLSLFPE